LKRQWPDLKHVTTTNLKLKLQETWPFKNVMEFLALQNHDNMGVGAAAADKKLMMVLLLICKLLLVKNQFTCT
jgi:hypothetical protein